MVVLWYFDTGEAAGMAEAALIREFYTVRTCLNKARGDDGRTSSSRYLYVVVQEGNCSF